MFQCLESSLKATAFHTLSLILGFYVNHSCFTKPESLHGYQKNYTDTGILGGFCSYFMAKNELRLTTIHTKIIFQSKARPVKRDKTIVLIVKARTPLALLQRYPRQSSVSSS